MFLKNQKTNSTKTIDMNTETRPKEEALKDYINYLSNEQIEWLLELLKKAGSMNKRHLLELSDYTREQGKRYDTATPIQYIESVRAIYPQLDKGQYIFDYTNNTWGELVNVNDLFVEKMLKVFNR